MSASASSEPLGFAPRALVRPRQGLVTASGVTALLTGAVAIWTAFELGLANVTGLPWVVWLLIALPPAVTGAVCLVRRHAGSVAPAAVFASCAAVCGYAAELPEGRSGLVLAASVSLLLCAGVAVVVSGIVTAVLISTSGSVSRRRAAVWIAAGLVFAALSIPSPIYIPGGPIQTIFSGTTGGENAAAACNVILLALPLVIAGRAASRMAAVMVLAWLPVAAAQPLGWYVFRLSIVRLDTWYYLNWLVWLAVAALALVEARSWRSGPGDVHASPPGS